MTTATAFSGWPACCRFQRRMFRPLPYWTTTAPQSLQRSTGTGVSGPASALQTGIPNATQTRCLNFMQNPWLALPEIAPLVLPADAALLDAFNKKAAAEYRYDFSLFPEPYFGSRTASVVVLNLNPGWSKEDAAVHAQPEFAAMARASLAHALKPIRSCTCSQSLRRRAECGGIDESGGSAKT